MDASLPALDRTHPGYRLNWDAIDTHLDVIRDTYFRQYADMFGPESINRRSEQMVLRDSHLFRHIVDFQTALINEHRRGICLEYTILAEQQKRHRASIARTKRVSDQVIEFITPQMQPGVGHVAKPCQNCLRQHCVYCGRH